MTAQWRFKCEIELRDLWIGVFWEVRPDQRFSDVPTRHFYICLLPALLIHVFQEVK